MNIQLEYVGTYLSVITFGCVMVNFVVIKPLQTSINHLQKSVSELSIAINDQRERLAKVEASASQAHHRIDELARCER